MWLHQRNQADTDARELRQARTAYSGRLKNHAFEVLAILNADHPHHEPREPLPEQLLAPYQRIGAAKWYCLRVIAQADQRMNAEALADFHFLQGLCVGIGAFTIADRMSIAHALRA